ncbi:hypothetical protein NE562_05500 [Butyricicoccus faecihominis]|uniref:hypothetical protein n=1 Tax=Butyricicoccus faecihominis TaxID=1712515 RepID=UPI00247AE8DE|nr:hypothetical protein [Butyricicoccus faecihominis]MCQ5129107.1 hypothetical protein [Butyricicoccus faecihominis]
MERIKYPIKDKEAKLRHLENIASCLERLPADKLLYLAGYVDCLNSVQEADKEEKEGKSHEHNQSKQL